MLITADRFDPGKDLINGSAYQFRQRDFNGFDGIRIQRLDVAIHNFNAVDQDFFLRNKAFVVLDDMSGDDEIQGF